MELRDRVVFITGAARGIGAATAREVARRGARVSLCGLEPDELERVAAELGAEHAWFEADVTDRASLDTAVAGTVEELGGIDVVVANAGIGTYGTVERFDPEAFARTIDVNLVGVFRTVQAALPHVLERRGYVLIVASVASYAAMPGMSAYGASKAGVDALAGSLRQEVAFRGVDTGTVHPGWIDTDLVREAQAELESFRRIRDKLPWPLKATISEDDCGRAIADGIERRARRIHIPRGVGTLYWLRSLVTSPAGERAVARDAPEFVPMLEREVEALGRAASERTARINELDERERASIADE